MTTRQTRLDRATANARQLIGDAVREFETSRLALGLSYAAVGRAVGMSQSQVRRVVHGDIDDVGIHQICRLHAAVGLQSIIRTTPSSQAIVYVSRWSGMGVKRQADVPALAARMTGDE